jgi:thiamine kinase
VFAIVRSPSSDVANPRVLLAGGYRNAVWKVRNGRTWSIEKHYDEDPGSPNPMYPNLPDHEALAMQLLAGTQCAPELIDFQPASDSEGSKVRYRFVRGSQWRRGTADVAELLHRIHHHPLKSDAASRMRRLHLSAAQARCHADAMFDEVPPSLAAKALIVRPSSRTVRVTTPALVHTDCGPGNIIRAASGPVLIDWQCPGLGDPVEDIACFLSPAMMILYATPPHGPNARASFLAAYADAAIIERYHLDGASWHYRIAAYCAWRAHALAQRLPDVALRYRQALAAEIKLLEAW